MGLMDKLKNFLDGTHEKDNQKEQPNSATPEIQKKAEFPQIDIKDPKAVAELNNADKDKLNDLLIRLDSAKQEIMKKYINLPFEAETRDTINAMIENLNENSPFVQFDFSLLYKAIGDSIEKMVKNFTACDAITTKSKARKKDLLDYLGKLLEFLQTRSSITETMLAEMFYIYAQLLVSVVELCKGEYDHIINQQGYEDGEKEATRAYKLASALINSANADMDKNLAYLKRIDDLLSRGTAITPLEMEETKKKLKEDFRALLIRSEKASMEKAKREAELDNEIHELTLLELKNTYRELEAKKRSEIVAQEQRRLEEEMAEKQKEINDIIERINANTSEIKKAEGTIKQLDNGYTTAEIESLIDTNIKQFQ